MHSQRTIRQFVVGDVVGEIETGLDVDRQEAVALVRLGDSTQRDPAVFMDLGVQDMTALGRLFSVAADEVQSLTFDIQDGAYDEVFELADAANAQATAEAEAAAAVVNDAEPVVS